MHFTPITPECIESAFNSFRPSDEYICVGKLAIVGSDNGLNGTKPLYEPVLEYC